ncbi:ABC transporter permease [Arthrobacter gengyunqii]|uniref:ABC transporter permease n=1 Tax=Arthrobacter gengyunqii TaxID=2886940 RepID=A0ABS8GEB0_9MICC|nr:ABC transporter permease [Arthrobacter gengyunqii]MCC3264801.1 ABC transporter permease [Arthrobacter gengyunqii]
MTQSVSVLPVSHPAPVHQSSASPPLRKAQPAQPTRLRLAVRAFGRDKAALVSLTVLLLVGMAALFAPLLAPHDPLVGDASQRLAPPLTPGHILGVDGQGRDILSRLLYGGRYSLGVAIVPVLLAFPLALAIGLFAGAGRTRLGSAMMRALDAVFAFPIVLLALAIAAVIGGGMSNVMLAIFITLIPYMARVAYTAAVQESGKEYIEAARCQGASNAHILFRELLPNVMSPLVVYATANCGLMIVVGAGLSFLGVGIQPPTPDWGVMTADGNQVLLEGYAHVATVPGLAILLAAVAFNLLGDGLRDALDPRKQTS